MGDFRTTINAILDLSSQDSGDDFEDMVKASINRIYRDMLRATNEENERREFSLTTVSGTSKYGMPLYVRDILNIEDSANNKRIYDISAKDFDTTYPGTTETGDPAKAYKWGRFGVQKQSSSATAVRIVSSSTSDGGSDYNLRVTGYVSDVLTSETLELNGTNQVTSSNTFDADGIERITKRSTEGVSWSGTLTFSTAGGTTLATLPIWWDSPTYQWYEFWPTPDTARTYTVRAIARKPDLLNDEDWPEIDEDFHNVLEWGAAAEVLPHIGKQEHSDRFAAKYRDGLREYKGLQQAERNRLRVFADVTSEPMISARPQIAGIDFV